MRSSKLRQSRKQSRRFKQSLFLRFSAELRELKRQIKDGNDPVRYVVYSEIGLRKPVRFFLDVSDSSYGMNSLDRATLFKRKDVAFVVAKIYSRTRSGLLVAKITTRNGNRKILRYALR